jgi:transcriptional regulator with XRE-family HTH domain
MTRDSSPTVRRRRLVQELRRLRTEAGLSQESVAGRLEWSLSKQQKIELGRVSVSVNDVRAMLELYGATDREPLLQLARDARKRGWWHEYGDVVPDWFETFVGLEGEASAIRSYNGQLVPGMFQTADYARALLHAGFPAAGTDDVERRVTLRVARQSLLTKQSPPSVWAVIDEAALRRVVGGPAVMSAQLRELLSFGVLPNVAVQVIPFTAGAHTAMEFPFTLFGFPEPADPDVVFVEYVGGGLYLEKGRDIERHTLMFDELRAIGYSPGDSLDMIELAIRTLQ